MHLAIVNQMPNKNLPLDKKKKENFLKVLLFFFGFPTKHPPQLRIFLYPKIPVNPTKKVDRC